MSYLNHAGTSWPKPEPVRRAVAAALGAPADGWAEELEASHARVARAFGVSEPERLLLTPGCTSALSLAFADFAWEAGDRVLTSSLEHHALQRPALALQHRGVELVHVPRAADGPLDLDALRGELRRGRARVVAMTGACNVTGELLPLADVTRLAHEHGARVLVDGAQIAGWLPIDLAASGVDVFTFAGHKGLQAPWGLGGLFVAAGVPMAPVGATCELPSGAAPPACPTMPGYCDAGSVDRAALAGLVAALDWLEEPAAAGRLERARGRTERLAAALEVRPGVRLHGRRDPAARLPTVAFTREGASVEELARAFERRGVTVGAGLQCAPLAHGALGTAPDGVVRLSAGPMTTDGDVERALEVVAALGGA